MHHRISGRALFGKIANLCGLEGGVGASVVRRGLAHSGRTPENASHEDYCRSLSAIAALLRAHKPDEAVERVIAKMAAIVGNDAGRPTDLQTLVTGLRQQTADLTAALADPPRWKKRE